MDHPSSPVKLKAELADLHRKRAMMVRGNADEFVAESQQSETKASN